MQAWRSFSLGVLLVVAGLGVAVITGRETNPYTGRSQLLMTSGSEEMQIGAQAYSQVKNDPSSGSRKIPERSNRSSGSLLGL
jgi:metalloendopeptidase OMA1, mitochondrial